MGVGAHIAHRIFDTSTGSRWWECQVRQRDAAVGQATARTLEMIEHGVVGKHRGDAAEIDDTRTGKDHGINAPSAPPRVVDPPAAQFPAQTVVMTGSSIVDQALHNAQRPIACGETVL